MEKLVNIFKNSSSTDWVDYMTIATPIVAIAVLIVMSMANADELLNQTLERSISAPYSTLDR